MYFYVLTLASYFFLTEKKKMGEKHLLMLLVYQQTDTLVDATLNTSSYLLMLLRTPVLNCNQPVAGDIQQ